MSPTSRSTGRKSSRVSSVAMCTPPVRADHCGDPAIVLQMLGSFRERLGESMDAFRAVITSPALRRVELSWAASITAYWAFIIALAVYAYDQGGAKAVGLVGVIRVLPAFVAAPFAGVLGDRYRREL